MTATSSNPGRNPVTATPDPRTTPETAEEARGAAQQAFLAAVAADSEFAAAVGRFLRGMAAAFRELTDEQRERMAAFGRAGSSVLAASTAEGRWVHVVRGDECPEQPKPSQTIGTFRPTTETGQPWWCTTHQDHLRWLAASTAVTGEPEWKPRAGFMHPVDESFYRLAIKERDYERLRADRLAEEVASLKAAATAVTGQDERRTYDHVAPRQGCEHCGGGGSVPAGSLAACPSCGGAGYHLPTAPSPAVTAAEDEASCGALAPMNGHLCTKPQGHDGWHGCVDENSFESWRPVPPVPAEPGEKS